MDKKAINDIIELARWAPSGDNTQPWRFEIIDDSTVVVHGFDTRDHCVYDLDGHASQISLGALLETASIAASGHGLRMEVLRRDVADIRKPTFELRLVNDDKVGRDSLIDVITRRSVQRRAMNTRSLTLREKQSLESAAGPNHRVVWLEGLGNRLRTALLMFRSAKLRLTMPEAYAVHRDVIEWNARFSEDKVPDQALGVDRATLHLMQFVMKSWERVRFFNTFLAGTWIPRIQMDMIPAIACGAHFVLYADKPPSKVDDYVTAGRAMQRFWLTATELGLVMQPEITPLIFARYARENLPFSRITTTSDRARSVSAGLESLIGEEVGRTACFMGRLGAGPEATSRSTRRQVAQLMT